MRGRKDPAGNGHARKTGRAVPALSREKSLKPGGFSWNALHFFHFSARLTKLSKIFPDTHLLKEVSDTMLELKDIRYTVQEEGGPQDILKGVSLTVPDRKLMVFTGPKVLMA